MSRGLPQGGVRSPLLWLVHFNRFFELLGSPLGSRKPRDPTAQPRGIRLGYADDVTIAYAHERATELARLAESGDAQTRGALGDPPPETEIQKVLQCGAFRAR